MGRTMKSYKDTPYLVHEYELTKYAMGYGVYFVSCEFIVQSLLPALVIAVLNAISCYIEACHNDSWLYNDFF